MRKRTTRDREQPARDRPPLTRETIVAAAVRLIDDKGLDAFSMRALGTSLDVDPMAIYYHISSKALLFDEIVAAMYHEVEVPPPNGRVSWDDYFLTWLHAYRAALLRHPQVLPIVATRPPQDPAVWALLEDALTLFTAAGLSLSDAMSAINCAAVFTVGHALAQVGQPVGGESDPGFRRMKEQIAHLPHLAAAISLGYHPDEEFSLGVRSLLRGLTAPRTHLAVSPE
jgi:AcrR family transcriptional regulator